jgi:hypothetical protein
MKCLVKATCLNREEIECNKLYDWAMSTPALPGEKIEYCCGRKCAFLRKVISEKITLVIQGRSKEIFCEDNREVQIPIKKYFQSLEILES